MKKIIAVISLCVAVVLLIWFGAGRLQSTHLTVTDAQLPTTLSHYKIAYIADCYDEDKSKIVELLEAEKPNMIVVTGRLFVEQEKDLYSVGLFLEKATRIAPVYIVPVYGEREQWELDFYDTAKAIGVTLLENTTVHVQEMMIAGITNTQEEKAQQLLRQLQQEKGYKLLFTTSAKEIAALQPNVNVVFAGDTMGGYVRLPFTNGLLAKDGTWFPTYTAGLYSLEKATMIVSRGVGNDGVYPRIGNNGEVVFAILESK